MDGSAASFVYLIQQAGIRAQARMRRRIVIRRPIEVRDGNRYVRVVPSRELKLSVEINYAHPAIGRQSIDALVLSPEVFAREIAPARTFGFLKDTQQLRAMGLARGGSLANAIVLDETRVLNPEGLRFRDEFARHKALDLIGDLALLGVPLQGHVKAVRGGHQLHQALVAEIRANPSCWSLETPGSERELQPEAGVFQPALRPSRG
jgi:UDP-3-O-[3-hydroxymyristoyl] N-acetylglucosamine deacetylase